MPDTPFNTLIRNLRSAKSAGQFSPYVEFIQFSGYKNFIQNSRVTFAFPLTVIVGPNGCGKTSLLHALYGAPKNKSPGYWWFGTALDPSEDQEDDKSTKKKRLSAAEKGSFWYGYKNAKEDREVVKMRIRRVGEPDYWETSRPIAGAGMRPRDDKSRDPAIEMDAIYMNFKTQITAFDRCFYFPSEHLLKRLQKTKRWQIFVAKTRRKVSAPRIQDYLRFRAEKLRKVLVSGETVSAGSHILHHPVIQLSEEELQAIGEIIGRRYSKGAILDHRFYENWGTSVLFTTAERTYSEAFAGSGESAVARLVHTVHQSPPGRLLLLDEPETSLHPGAQQKLVHYLLKQSLAKKLQIVISTHAPSIIRGLPPEAITVFSTHESSRIEVTQNVSSDEAFYVIGHPTENQIQILVEDKLAKQLLEAIIHSEGAPFAARFQVDFRPGGASMMYKDASMYMLDKDDNVFFLFDGDSQPSDENRLGSRPVNVADSHVDLDARIKEATKCDVHFRQDSNMTSEDKVQCRRQYIDFGAKKFFYFPFPYPEAAIWDDDTAKVLLSIAITDDDEVSRIMRDLTAEVNHKARFEKLVGATLSPTPGVTGADINSIHKLFIKRYCEVQGADFREVLKIARGMADHA